MVYYAEYLAVIFDEEKRANVPYITPVLAPRNELNIYWEYTLKFFYDKNPFKSLDRYIRKKFKMNKKNTYSLDYYFITPVFKGKIGKKQKGFRVLFIVVLPALLVSGLALNKAFRALIKMSPRRRIIILTILSLLIAAIAF